MKKKKILIIEDEENIRELLKDNLEYEGFHPILAGDAEQGGSDGGVQPVGLDLFAISQRRTSGIDYSRFNAA